MQAVLHLIPIQIQKYFVQKHMTNVFRFSWHQHWLPEPRHSLMRFVINPQIAAYTTNKTTSYPLNSLSHVDARHRHKTEGIRYIHVYSKQGSFGFFTCRNFLYNVHLDTLASFELVLICVHFPDNYPWTAISLHLHITDASTINADGTLNFTNFGELWSAQTSISVVHKDLGARQSFKSSARGLIVSQRKGPNEWYSKLRERRSEVGYTVNGMPVGKPCVLIARAPRVMTIGDSRALPASRKHSDGLNMCNRKNIQRSQRANSGLLRITNQPKRVGKHTINNTAVINKNIHYYC